MNKLQKSEINPLKNLKNQKILKLLRICGFHEKNDTSSIIKILLSTKIQQISRQAKIKNLVQLFNQNFSICYNKKSSQALLIENLLLLKVNLYISFKGEGILKSPFTIK